MVCQPSRVTFPRLWGTSGRATLGRTCRVGKRSSRPDRDACLASTHSDTMERRQFSTSLELIRVHYLDKYGSTTISRCTSRISKAARLNTGPAAVDVLCWIMPKFRVQFFHIICQFAKTRFNAVQKRKIFCKVLWTAISIGKADLITGDSNMAGQMDNMSAVFVDWCFC